MNGPAHPHVLVVDDHAPSRYSTRRALTAAGFMVSEAATGGEALALCTEDPPDVVLLDVNLPDMDGFEVCRKLRGSERTAQLPVIHLSATYLENHHRVQGLDAGADGYLTHPVEPVVLVATLRAVLRARSAERAAQRREAEFGAIFERAPNGICLLDPSLAYRDVNPALCQMLGHSRDELLGRCFLDHVTPAERQRATGLAEIVARDRQWRGQLAFRTARNEVVHLLWAVSEHAIPDMLLGIVTDITERRRIEHDRERLLISERAARADAERANRLKDEFLATLSHELRSPLNAIIGWVHVLQSGRMDAGERARGLDVIERNARIQAQLISDLLDVSRIISGKLTLDVERVVPGEMIQAALEGVRPAAQSKGIALDVRVDPAAPVLWGDSARLQQVVWNLVHNAIKFTPKGGRVEVMLHAAGDGVEIVVRDEGIGISPEFLPQLFQRFRQEDATATRTRGGLGLGLAIVKQVVEMHGGRVNASSAGVNQGATFLVFLPVGQPAQARPLTAHPGQGCAADLTGVRVLVVDDDDDARAFVRRLLSERGATIEEAPDVARAVAALQRFAPHVLISDLGMPVQDGYDLIHILRQSGHDIPAIALTAYAREEDRRRALDSGFQEHVTKPIDRDRLLRAITRLVAR